MGSKRKIRIDPELKRIIKKCNEHKLTRHINGNTMDNRIQNLLRVSAKNALKNKNWTVDACLCLTEDELEIWEKARGN